MNNFFIKIVFSVCSGTEIFREIIKFSTFKAIRHLIFLAVICSFAFVLVKTPEIRKEINNFTSFLDHNFGNIIVKNNGIYPEKEPNKPRNLSYDSMQISYYPEFPSNNKLNINNDLNLMGYVWLPNNIFIWKKFDKTNFLIYPALYSEDTARNMKIVTGMLNVIPKEDLISYIKKFNINEFKNLKVFFAAQFNYPLMAFLDLKKNATSFTDLSSNAFTFTVAGIIIVFFAKIFLNAIIYSLLFAAIYSITNRSNQYNLKFKGFWIVAVYACFPGIIIGTIFSAANLIWLQYQTVFLVAFIVYLMAVTQKLRKINAENNLNN